MENILSIIVTSYNIEKYIEECINCLDKVKQNNYEIIFVDDGSNDKTVDKIKNFCIENENVKTFFIEKNTVGGVATAANIGLKISTGKYIAFVDGDDIFEPTIFSDMLASLEKYDSDVVICDYKEFFVSENGENIYQDHAYEQKWQSLCGRNFVDLNLEPNLRKDILTLIAVPWRKIYKRSFLQDKSILFPEGDFFFEDNAFHWFVVTQANSISFIDETLYFHRKNRVGQTMGASGAQLIKIFIQHEIIFKFLNDKNIFFTYKNSLILWFFNQICWTYVSINKKYYDLFFRVVRNNFLLYSNKDFREFFLKYDFDVKIIEIWYSIYSNDFSLFSKVMSGTINRDIFHKIKFNISRIGISKTIMISSSFIKNIVTSKLINRFITENIFRLKRKNAYDNAYNVSNIHTCNIKIDELIAEVRVIEKNINMVKEDLRNNNELMTNYFIILDEYIRNNVEKKDANMNWCHPVDVDQFALHSEADASDCAGK